MNRLSRFLKVTLKVCIPVFAAVSLSAQGVNKYIPVSKHVSNDNGITWPYGQVIPPFCHAGRIHLMPLIYKREFLMMKN